MNKELFMELAKKVKAIPYWYHRIELPDGTVTPGWSPIDPDRYCIPEDLTGMRVLDIGAWDGYWTWEALKRGAKEVVAIDDFSDYMGRPEMVKRNRWETFDICREAFGFTNAINGDDSSYDIWYNEKHQNCIRREISIYDIGSLGQFDIVFFFGTIYHLKHPLLALEKISSVCKGALYVETASLDEYSPYRGGVGCGFDRNEMVMEFYPGKQYANNESNWWTPTLQCLGAMMESVGFKDIECWPLKENPKELPECRGFASGTKDPEKFPANHPEEVTTQKPLQEMKVAAVMSVPRLGFMDNHQCAVEALYPLRIPLISVQGAFWGQCLERGMQQIIDAGVDIILTIDYDTVFKKKDVEDILRLMYQHPEATAIVPIQKGRGDFPVLMSMKSKSGQPRGEIPLTEFKGDVAQIATGHFGLTAFRVKDLLDIPHPWIWDMPNNDNQWGPGRIDADIYFWKQLEKHNKKALLACRVIVGHLQLMATWLNKELKPFYQMPGDFHDKGKPENTWK
jgi:tRNA (mo5U34)-methyltransferase